MHSPISTRPHHSPEQRQRIIAAYRRSELTQREFAAQVGIGCSTLARWLRQAATGKVVAEPAFVSLPHVFSASTVPLAAYRLQFPGGVSLEVAAGFQVEELSRLLELVHQP